MKAITELNKPIERTQEEVKIRTNNQQSDYWIPKKYTIKQWGKLFGKPAYILLIDGDHPTNDQSKASNNKEKLEKYAEFLTKKSEIETRMFNITAKCKTSEEFKPYENEYSALENKLWNLKHSYKY